jgi:hypothetical protein
MCVIYSFDSLIAFVSWLQKLENWCWLGNNLISCVPRKGGFSSLGLHSFSVILFWTNFTDPSSLDCFGNVIVWRTVTFSRCPILEWKADCCLYYLFILTWNIDYENCMWMMCKELALATVSVFLQCRLHSRLLRFVSQFRKRKSKDEVSALRYFLL